MNFYEYKIKDPILSQLCSLDPDVKKVMNNFFLHVTGIVQNSLNNPARSSTLINNMISDQIISSSQEPTLLNAILSGDFDSEINQELEEMFKKHEKIDVRQAAKNVAASLLISEHTYNEQIINNNAARLTYEIEVQPKLSDKYRSLFEVMPMQDDNNQIISFKDKLILDTSRAFTFGEAIDGDVNGETLFSKMDSRVAMQILIDIKTGLAQLETRQKEFFDVADEIINDEFEKKDFTIKNGCEQLEKNFSEKLKQVCQEKGIFFNFNKADRKVKKEPEKLVQQHLKKKTFSL